jgi:quercetin dioxygenase-like cupin family protein
MNRFAVGLAFIAGACASAAAPSTASPPVDASASTAATAAAPPGPRLVIPAADAPRRQAPNGKATVTMLAEGHNAFLARLEMQPGAAVPEHQDSTEEYVHILSGEGSVTIDGQAHPVAAGTTIYMPPGATVSFENGAQTLSAIQVFAGPEPAKKYDAWTVLP